MADSETKKPIPATSTANKATVKKNKSKQTAKASQSVANKQSTTKAVASDKKTSTEKSKTQKPETAQTKASANAAKKVESKASTKSAVKADASTTDKKGADKKDVAKKEKRSGGGIAFLALLCSIGALGLSGYNYYQQNLAPQSNQSQDVLLSGVNDIKSNVTEFGTVVAELQQDVKDFKASQNQYITEDALVSVVKESVDDAVQNLPDLPNIGPKPISEKDESQREIAAQGNSSQDSSAIGDASVQVLNSDKVNGKNVDDPSIKSEEISSVSDDVSSAEEEDSVWSWDRAKNDMKGMLNSFIKIEKTKEN